MSAIDILKFGLPGFAFLVIIYNFKLLKEALGRESRIQSSRKVTAFMVMNMGLVALVGTLELLHSSAQGRLRDVKACRDSLERLDTVSKLPQSDANNLRSGVASHVSICRPLLATEAP